MSASRREIARSLRTNFQPGPRDYMNRLLLRLRQVGHLPAWIVGGSLKQPVLIVGAPRSGTSLLFRILRSSRHLSHWPGEAHEVWEARHHPALREWDSNALTGADADEVTIRSVRRSFFLVTGARKRLIDKTPRNALRVPFVDAIFPDARYVFLRRDGRDNVNSLINAWRTPRYRTYRLPEPHAIQGVDPNWWKFVLYPGWREDRRGPLEVVCARQWHLSNDRALDAFEGIRDRVVDLAYEDLVARPVAEVERVMNELELPFDGRLRDRAAELSTTPINVVTPPERGKWRKENPRELRSVLHLIAPTMTRMGYPAVDED